MPKINMGFQFNLQFFINQVDTLAPTPAELVAPCDGYIEGLQVIVQIAPTTGGPVTVKVGTTDVAGLSVTVADAAVKGTVYTDYVPTNPSASRQFKKGDRIQILPDAAFNTAGAISGNLLCRDSATISA